MEFNGTSKIQNRHGCEDKLGLGLPVTMSILRRGACTALYCTVLYCTALYWPCLSCGRGACTPGWGRSSAPPSWARTRSCPPPSPQRGTPPPWAARAPRYTSWDTWTRLLSHYPFLYWHCKVNVMLRSRHFKNLSLVCICNKFWPRLAGSVHNFVSWQLSEHCRYPLLLSLCPIVPFVP